jgi:hypothetical protein
MLSALHKWYITLTGFDPYSPCNSGERCSLTGLKIGRAAFSYGVPLVLRQKRRVDTPVSGHTHSHLPIAAYWSSLRRKLLMAMLYRLRAIVTLGLVGESRLLILAIDSGASPSKP